MFNRIVLFGSLVLFASARRSAEHRLSEQGARLEQALARERIARGRGRNRQPDEGRVPGDGLARAAHAAERDPRLGRLRSTGTRRRADLAPGARVDRAQRPGAGPLVDDMLDFSRHRAPASCGSTRSRSTLAAIVRDGDRDDAARRRRRSTIASRADAATRPTVPGDPDRLQQIAVEPAVERREVHARAADASRCGWRARGDRRASSKWKTPGPGIDPGVPAARLRARSGRPTRRRRARTAASASGWRSSATSSSCTAARSPPRAPRPAAAPSSRSGSRSPAAPQSLSP